MLRNMTPVNQVRDIVTSPVIENVPNLTFPSDPTPLPLIPNSTPEEDGLVTTAAVSDSAILGVIVVELARLSQTVDVALGGTALLRRRNRRINRRGNPSRNFTAVMTAVSQAEPRRETERVYRPMEEKRKQKNILLGAPGQTLTVCGESFLVGVGDVSTKINMYPLLLMMLCDQGGMRNIGMQEKKCLL